MYSLTNRLNTIMYSAMITLLVAAALNHITVRWGHLANLEPKVELLPTDISFATKEVDMFAFDKIYNEEILSFNFDLAADLKPLMTWNTHTIFASLVCQYKTDASDLNEVTVWDQRIRRDDPEHHLINVSSEFIEYYLTDINK